MGDYLVTRALCLASSVEPPSPAGPSARPAAPCARASSARSPAAATTTWPRQEYLEIIADKTAALTACCCRLGAHYAGARPRGWKTLLAQYGLDLGVAFQIADDLLDVLGDEATVGKSLGTDLVEAEIDPAADPRPPAGRSTPSAPRWSPCSRARATIVCQALRPWLERFDAVAYAQAKALDYSRLAQEGLRSIPPGARGTPCTSWPASWSPANTRT